MVTAKEILLAHNCHLTLPDEGSQQWVHDTGFAHCFIAGLDDQPPSELDTPVKVAYYEYGSATGFPIQYASLEDVFTSSEFARHLSVGNEDIPNNHEWER